MNRSALALFVGVWLPLLGCGSSAAESEPVTFQEYVASFTFDYNPAASLADLSVRSSVVAQAQLLDVEDGAIFGTTPEDPAANHSLNLIFETDDGERYYVELPRPAYMSVEQLRAAMPLDSASVIYLQPNNDPRDANFFNVREGPTWFFTTPQGWILADPERGNITPLEGTDSLGFEAPDGGDADLRAWLVDPKTPSA